MRLQRIINAVYYEPWLIKPSAHASIRKLIDSKLEQSILRIKSDRPTEDIFGNDLRVMTIENGIATIPICGVIGRGMSAFEKSCGAVGVEDISADIKVAIMNLQVKGILLDFDSPGGNIGGVPELADEIKLAATIKPVIAYTDGLMASGAYWLASGASAIYGSKSSEIGSIGVYLPWLDESLAYAMQGIKIELIKNKEGTYKGAGYPGTTLTDEQLAEFQNSVDEIFTMFSESILASRPNVSKDAMRGQTFFGKKSVDSGLADSITNREQAVSDLLMLANS